MKLQVSTIDNFPCNVTRMRKFDYYSTDHTWRMGGRAEQCFKCIALYGENPTSAHIPACNAACEIATCEEPSPFVEQRKHFQLPFVASPCDFPSPRYSQMKITLLFDNTGPAPIVDFLISRPLHKGFQ